MLATVLSTGLLGIDAHRIEFEVDLRGAIPQFSVVGRPDATVHESRARVRAALKNSGCSFPVRKFTVNVATVSIPCVGRHLQNCPQNFMIDSTGKKLVKARDVEINSRVKLEFN